MAKKTTSWDGPVVRGKHLSNVLPGKKKRSGYVSEPSRAEEVIGHDAFAARLFAAMAEKGFNGAQLAKEAQKYMPKGQVFGRHLVSNYLRGAHLPTNVRLIALSKALGKKITELVPDDQVVYMGGTGADIDLRVNKDRARLRIDRDMSTEAAMKIVAIIEADKDN